LIPIADRNPNKFRVGTRDFSEFLRIADFLVFNTTLFKHPCLVNFGALNPKKLFSERSKNTTQSYDENKKINILKEKILAQIT